MRMSFFKHAIAHRGKVCVNLLSEILAHLRNVRLSRGPPYHEASNLRFLGMYLLPPVPRVVVSAIYTDVHVDQFLATLLCRDSAVVRGAPACLLSHRPLPKNISTLTTL